MALRDLLERAAITPSKVERDPKTGAIVIRRVKFLGPRSANLNADGTRNAYPLEARQRALPLYEGVSVFLNHPDRSMPGRERGYDEKLGDLRECSAEADGSYADLHINPEHPVAKQVAWDAEHAPARLGLSHNAQGRGRVRGGEWIAEEISTVRSVDLVAAGATTRSLYESRREDEVGTKAKKKTTKAPAKKPLLEEEETSGESGGAAAPSMADLLAVLSDETLEAEAKIAKLLAMIAGAAHAPKKDDEGGEESEAEATESRREPEAGDDELSKLRRELDELKVQRAAEERRAKRQAQLTESKLPAEALTEVFLEQVHAADEPTAKRLIEDRRKVFFSRSPVSSVSGGSAREFKDLKDVGAFMAEED